MRLARDARNAKGPRCCFDGSLQNAPSYEPPGASQRSSRHLEGIVSKRLGSRYRSGRSTDWLKSKNPAAPAGKREAEERGSAKLKRRGGNSFAPALTLGRKKGRPKNKGGPKAREFR